MELRSSKTTKRRTRKDKANREAEKRQRSHDGQKVMVLNNPESLQLWCVVDEEMWGNSQVLSMSLMIGR